MFGAANFCARHNPRVKTASGAKRNGNEKSKSNKNKNPPMLEKIKLWRLAVEHNSAIAKKQELIAQREREVEEQRKDRSRIEQDKDYQVLLRARRVEKKLAEHDNIAVASLATYRKAVNELDRTIEETSDPRIAAFISWLFAERQATYGQLRISTEISTNHLTDERIAMGASNKDSVDKRVAAIDRAIESARALIYRSGVDVARELKKLRDGLPDVSPELGTEKYPVDVHIAEANLE